MLVDTTVGAIEDAAAAASAAEAAGYAGIFTGEVSSDPFLPLVLAAAATERITVGTSIAVAFARSPMSLAYTAYDLQRFSGGRLVLGLGSQVKAHIIRRFAMPWGRPAAQMREFVLALRSIWNAWSDGEWSDFEGEYYRHTLMPSGFAPKPHEFGAPPVYVAGVGDTMTRVAGEVADGFLCHGFTTERWIREHTIPALTEGRASTGRSMDGFTVKAATFVISGTESEMEAQKAALQAQLAFYASTPAYRPVLDLHGWGELGTELTQLSKAGRWSEMGHLIDDDILQAFAVVAAPEDVPTRLAERCAGLIDRVSLIGGSLDPARLAAIDGSPPPS